MLVKHDQQSDGRSYGRVTIFGKSSLKAVFMGAATTVIQYGGPLKTTYEEQKALKLDHKAAKKNLARKIASIALAVMRTGEPYKAREVTDTKSDSILN